MTLRLEDAAMQLDSGYYPFLSVTINGQPARVYLDQKYSLLEQDLVFLGAEWGDRVEEIELPDDPKRDRGGLTLRGFVRDKRLAGLILQLRALEAEGIVQTGPIVIPEEES